MIIVKLLVVSYFIIICAYATEYCGICRNHTLCLYPIPGPSSSCIGYELSALLKKDDIVDIVKRINELRNNVALGHSKNLPQAANMKTVSWSEELAWSAQRWVDQCHSGIRPDKLDLCRDLKKTPVGQNIATILGTSSSLNTKSFVDMWYMQILNYDGNVSFYNQSRDSKSNYFLQLIWAQTDSVGCGKARFYIDRKTSVERLVCNFAPRGIVHGKPVYAIGVSATQCPDDYRPHKKYPGLCSYQIIKKDKLFKVQDSPKSLLRVINLSNTSAKHEIDPLNNNLKQSPMETDLLNNHRHQKSRHVVNNTYPHDMSHFMPYSMHNPMHNSMHNPMHNPMHSHNHSAIFSHINQHQPSRGCAGGVYHGQDQRQNYLPPYVAHNYRPNYVPPYQVSTDQNFRRFDMITQPSTLAPALLPETNTETNFRRQYQGNLPDENLGPNYRRYFQYNECTRSIPIPCDQPVPCVADKCTRGLSPCLGVTPPCSHVVVEPHEACPCAAPLPAPCPPAPVPIPPPAPPCYDAPPPCYPPCAPPCPVAHYTPCCPSHGLEHPVLKEETRKSGSELHYYDLFPNMVKRSGEFTSEKPPSKGIFMDKRTWRSQNPAFLKEKRVMKDTSTHQSKDSSLDYTDSKKEDDNYSFSSLNFRKRRKRETGEKITLKTFWKMDRNSNVSPLPAKSSRFTTLFNKGAKKSRDTTSNIKTESITLSFHKEEETGKIKKESNSHTEKYLSFDELMHLRKLNKVNLSGRRQAVKTTKKSKPALRAETESPPINYTTNTPFERKKYCTRKLTCTWTAFTATAADGSLINPGFDIPGGSRTPAGYVEGCTRTSTCTRDFLARNIGTTGTKKKPGQGDDDEDGEGDEDEDGDGANEEYCERRSLNVQKRNSDQAKTVPEFFNIKNISTNPPNYDEFKVNDDKISTENNNDCNCSSKSVVKKRDIGRYHSPPIITDQCNAHCDHKVESGLRNPLMSYGDLYYLVVNKIIKSWEDKKTIHEKECSCNTGLIKENNALLTMFLIFSVTTLY